MHSQIERGNSTWVPLFQSQLQSKQASLFFSSFLSNHPRAQHQNHTRTHYLQQWLKRVRNSLFFISAVYQSLSNSGNEHFIKVSFPNEMEESDGKSILHFTLSSFTLKHCIGTTQTCSCVKRNGCQCRQVYFWIMATKPYSQTQPQTLS